MVVNVWRRTLFTGALVALGPLLLVACTQATLAPTDGEATAVSGSVSATPNPNKDLILTPSPAEVQDAKAYAAGQGISLAEAILRLRQRDAVGGLGAALAANERDTFAGLWIQHQPEFRVIVQFTRDGEKTVLPYIENEPWADIIEVRTANVTLVELGAIRAETMQAISQLDFEVRLKSNVIENRVEVHVTDRTWFEGVLRAADIQLPDEVVMVVVDGLSVKDIKAGNASSVPGIAFPRQKPVEGERESMLALARGELVLVDGCLRKGSDSGDLLVWPADFTLEAENGVVQILDGTGQAVARVGDEVRMGGGQVSSAGQFGEYVRQQLPFECPGDHYWIVGEIVSATPIPSSTTDVAPTPEPRSSQLSSSVASCVSRFSPETVRERAFAFDGTVELVEMRVDPKLPLKEGQAPDLAWVTFTVNQWFNGGDSQTVEIWVDSRTPGAVWPLEPGDRLLAAGEYRWGDPPEDPLAWGCGFTQPYTPKAAAEWVDAMLTPQ